MASCAFCAQNKVDLPEALKWAERAVSDPFAGGQENFQTLAALAKLQALNSREAEAAKTFEKALNHRTANLIQIHMAARQLMAEGKKDEAVRVFQFNAKRFPNEWPVHVGLMRGYAATGDKKKAVVEAKLAFAQAPTRPRRRTWGASSSNWSLAPRSTSPVETLEARGREEPFPPSRSNLSAIGPLTRGAASRRTGQDNPGA